MVLGIKGPRIDCPSSFVYCKSGRYVRAVCVAKSLESKIVRDAWRETVGLNSHWISFK